MNRDLLTLQRGEEIGVSPWQKVEQGRITAFAEVTGDHQWIHVDVDRCASESTFGTTIAHGFLTTTLMPAAFYDMITLDTKANTLLNYGADKIRFLEPVRAGDEIRFRMSLIHKESKQAGILFKFGCNAEIRGRAKPAMVAEFLMLLVDKAKH